MATHEMFRKTIVWLFIAALVNPVTLMPFAHARDTDIFLSIADPTGATAEPNVLLILDTSDSMNLPEAWREYPGAYDSHVEYMWNDTVFISSVSTATLPPGDSPPLAPGNFSPTDPFPPGQLSDLTSAPYQRAMMKAMRTNGGINVTLLAENMIASNSILARSKKSDMSSKAKHHANVTRSTRTTVERKREFPPRFQTATIHLRRGVR